MQLYSNALALFALIALLDGGANAQDTSAPQFIGTVWNNDAPEQTNKLSMTRDMTVPAPCWRPPWSDPAVVPEVTPYFRDRFVLDWSERKVTGKNFYISVYVKGMDDSWTEFNSTNAFVQTVNGVVYTDSVLPPYLFDHSTALVSINKYADNALFVYGGSALDGDGPAAIPVGSTPEDNIQACNDHWAGCWALPIPPSDQIKGISLGVHAEDYKPTDPDPKKTYAQDKTRISDLLPILATDLATSDGKGLVQCDANQLSTATLPPMRKMVKRTVGPSQAQATEI